MRTLSKIIFASILLASPMSLAQDAPDSDDPPADDTETPADPTETPDSTAPPTPAGELPPPVSDKDPRPPVAAPALPTAGGIVSQAGVGGNVGYGRAGVLELGGSAGFAFASDYRNINFSPTIGWFIANNFEASAILSISNIKSGDADSSTLWTALLEPSYHLPFNRSLFGFVGVGVGASHISGLGTGFTVAPRIGANFMVGRSGVLTPSLSYQYTTINSDMTDSDVTVVALTSAVMFNVGYTAMW